MRFGITNLANHFTLTEMPPLRVYPVAAFSSPQNIPATQQSHATPPSPNKC
ncbi:hypothetical protein [Rubritalea tangerina]|uniref:hypothetical protein n=1 Tax=Rubritalea tangerina TaxID=430798 RepID=UPI0036228625